ncbi:hypothetical protein ET989_13665 [Propioniciclava sinopodophylli]|uniref:Uncharacterized protein n=1 Tax=Propioniciclava sinopodophylli TaxID=1837344 RepID=A0A4Q9KBP1_9ACTN|nr:hypothetical protein [Propioniciclava sinopodophylli]TBT82735.1 hypothetical protein ET989_13665 [Propioniciclava sinopodophylli]
MTEPLLYPLLAVDPPKVGDWWLDARLAAAPSGVAYTAHSEAGEQVMVVMLGEGATADAAAVDRLAGTVNKMHIDTVVARGGRGQADGRLGHRYVEQADTPPAPDAAPIAPWVALAWDGSPAAVAEAERILAEVDLSWLPPKGTPSGPDYQLPWIDKVSPGPARAWPLPWPGRTDRAGWLTILISWIIMMLLMALAVLLAILIFQATPPQSPPPPVPTSASATGSGSPPPDSGSPSPQSGSPSPASAEPSPGESGSAQPSPTMDRRL